MSEEDMKMKDYIWYVKDLKTLYANEVSARSPAFSIKLKKDYIWLTDEVKWRLLMTTVAEQNVEENIKYCQNREKSLQSSSTAMRTKIQEKDQKKQYIALYVQFVTKYFDSMPILKVTFSIWNPVDGIIFSKSKNILKAITGQHYGFWDFISIDELNKMEIQKLIIHCHFTEVKQDFKNFEVLLNNTLFSDLELHISGNKIPAHKMVLSLSSPFFREIFADEDSTTAIEIRDTEVEVFGELLRYLYTGNINEINVENRKLYISATKYQIWDLQASCFKVIQTNSTGDEWIQILLDCLKEGCTYSDLNDLAKSCAEYVAGNKRIILEDYFKDFVKTAPTFLFHTLREFSEEQGWAKWAIKIRFDTNEMFDPPLETISSQKHFEMYLNNETLSDIQIQIGDKKYFAHKVILTSRSPVFNKMFSNNMSETISGVVKIEDIKSQVFYELLRFMYTNEIKERNDTVEEILIAADKYEIDDLKSICEKILKKKVNKRNCYKVVQFADDHNAEELKKFCLYYIITNHCIQGFFYTPLWEFGEYYPHLIFEMLNIIYRVSSVV